MKSKQKRICIAFMILGMSMPSPVQALEKETTHVPITVDFSNETCTMEVVVMPGGSIKDGSQTIQEGSVTYELRLGASKDFIIVPDRAYQIDTVLYERMDTKETKDMTEAVIDRKVHMEARMVPQRITVTFKKIQEIPSVLPEKPEKPEKPKHPELIDTSPRTQPTSKGPSTNDDRDMELYFVQVLVATLLWMIVKEKKKQKE